MDEKLKECALYGYVPTIIDKVPRIIAIGDIHGDIKLAIKLLKLAKVINIVNKQIEWIGGDTVVIQTGDQLDGCRNPIGIPCFKDNVKGNIKKSDIRVFNLFTYLDKCAQKHGGRVISLLGNHELLNVLGKMEQYVSQDDIEYFSDFNTRKKMFKPGNKYAKILGCTRLLFVVVGSNFFCHGGLITTFINKLKLSNETAIETLQRVNNIFRKWLVTGNCNNKDIINLTLFDKQSILWERILGSIKTNMNMDYNECTNHFLPIMQMLKLNSMIVGHTPQIFLNNNSINGTCDNRLWRIDNALSQTFNNMVKQINENCLKRKLQVLEILDDKHFNILSS